MPNITQESYDNLAELYDKRNATSLANAFYERPALISLVPDDVNGKVLVDAGCGSGLLSQFLEKKGANIIAFDYSLGQINIAKTRLKSTNVRVADLENKLDFIETSSVDIITSSLVLHYIKNWEPVFKEFKRILKPEGVIIFSIHHPHQDWYWFNMQNYFEKKELEDEFNLEGNKFFIKVFHRTLMEVFDVFSKNKFYVDKLLEPFPLPEGESKDPKFYKSLITKPRFLFFRLKNI